MSKTGKKWIIGILIGVVLSIATIIIINYTIKSKIETAIGNLSESVEVSYSDIAVSVLKGNIQISNLEIRITGSTTQKEILSLQLDEIALDDISFISYVMDNTINLENLILNNALLIYNHNPVAKESSYYTKLKEQIKSKIAIDQINLTKSSLTILSAKTDATLMKADNINFTINDFTINPKQKDNSLINSKNYDLSLTDLLLNISPFESLESDSLNLSENNLKLVNVNLMTNYEIPEYLNRLKKERDHFNIQTKEIELLELDFGYDNDELFYFKADSTIISQPSAKIYRDKTLADDTSFKPLYSNLLRNLPFKLALKTIAISHGELQYLEKVNAGMEPGKLNFTNLDATISQLGNVEAYTTTSAKVNSLFMNTTNIEVDWEFKVQDSTDGFIFTADIGDFNASQLNQFSVPSQQLRLKGDVKQTYFTINGNATVSEIDLKVRYDDFEVIFLEEDSREKKGLLSGFVNIFVPSDTKDDDSKFRYGYANRVDRDTTKSVFNFLWKNVRTGLKSAITGNGEKNN